jgi:hypothetical protein
MTRRTASQAAAKRAAHGRKPQTVGESIIRGLKEAIAWTEGRNDGAHVTRFEVPEVDVRKVRLK